MLLTKYYIVCNGCGESTTKKANGDLGKVRMESIKDGWRTGYNSDDFCPQCAEKSVVDRGVAEPAADEENEASTPEPEPAPAPDPKAKEEKKPAPPEPESGPEADDDDDF